MTRPAISLYGLLLPWLFVEPFEIAKHVSLFHRLSSPVVLSGTTSSNIEDASVANTTGTSGHHLLTQGEGILSRRRAFQLSVAAVASAVVPQRSNSVSQHSVSSSRQSDTSLSSAQESLTGFVAGATMSATKTVVKYPLDTATVRLQLAAAAATESPYYTTSWSELFRGSLNGVATPLVANIPGGAVFFAVRDACKASLKTNRVTTHWPPWIQTCTAVAVAQIPYWLVRNPSEIVKTRQQAKLEGYTEGVSMIQGYRQVWLDATTASRDGGVKATQGSDSSCSTLSSLVDAFYLGYWENILYAYPADVIKFFVYDSWTRKLGGKQALSPLQGAVVGAGATAVAQLVTTPLDVVRNRLMASAMSNNTTALGTRQFSTVVSPGPGEDESDNDEPGESQDGRGYRQRSYWDTLTYLAESEGLPGLFAGAAPRVGKALISGAIQFATYEETKRDVARFLNDNKGQIFSLQSK